MLSGTVFGHMTILNGTALGHMTILSGAVQAVQVASLKPVLKAPGSSA